MLVAYERAAGLANPQLADAATKPNFFNKLGAVHQNGAVNSCGEYQPQENASRPSHAKAGEQPLPHNPRKQRKNTAAIGSGDAFRGGDWRREGNWRLTFSALRGIEFYVIFGSFFSYIASI